MIQDCLSLKLSINFHDANDNEDTDVIKAKTNETKTLST